MEPGGVEEVVEEAVLTTYGEEQRTSDGEKGAVIRQQQTVQATSKSTNMRASITAFKTVRLLRTWT